MNKKKNEHYHGIHLYARIFLPKFSQSNTEGGGGGGHSERKCIYIYSFLQKCTIVPKTDRLLVLIWIFLIQISWKHDKKVFTQEQFLPAAKKDQKREKGSYGKNPCSLCESAVDQGVDQLFPVRDQLFVGPSIFAYRQRRGCLFAAPAVPGRRRPAVSKSGILEQGRTSHTTSRKKGETESWRKFSCFYINKPEHEVNKIQVLAV
jgi:hypothetical protein